MLRSIKFKKNDGEADEIECTEGYAKHCGDWWSRWGIWSSLGQEDRRLRRRDWFRNFVGGM
jgi:hypothetical protein